MQGRRRWREEGKKVCRCKVFYPAKRSFAGRRAVQKDLRAVISCRLWHLCCVLRKWGLRWWQAEDLRVVLQAGICKVLVRKAGPRWKKKKTSFFLQGLFTALRHAYIEKKACRKAVNRISFFLYRLFFVVFVGRIANYGTSRVPPDTLWLCRPPPRFCEVKVVSKIAKFDPHVKKKKLLLLVFEVYSFILFINNFIIINQ